VRPKLLPFDHIHPPPARTLERPSRTAILYASLSSPNFRELHSYLFALADKPSSSIEYVFRPIPESADTGARNVLSGYGVSLDLKKTDYLAVDDRNTGPRAVQNAEPTSDAEVPDVDPILALIDAYPEPEIDSESGPAIAGSS
jgi:UDP-glucose:glycoprotein glucosyltransferase